VAILLGKKGLFTGSVVLEAKRFGVRGRFDDEGNAVLNLRSPSGVMVTINLLLENYIGAGLRVAGTISLGDELEMDFPCYLSAFDGTRNSSFGLTGKVVNTVFQCESGEFGHGFASANSAKDGTMKFAGRLADGTVWTGSARVVRDEIQQLSLPVAIPLTTVKGLLHGEMIVSEAERLALQSEVPMIWIRRADAKSKAFSEGIEEFVNARGSIWAPPKSGSILEDGLTTLNLTLDVDGIILGDAGGTLEGVWSGSNKAVFAKAPKGFSFRFTKTTGVFTGQIIPVNGASSKAVTYHGLLFNPALDDISWDGVPMHGAGFLATPNTSAAVELTPME
jgi:hypothetical protein